MERYPLKRRRRKRPKHGKVYGPYHRWIKGFPCVIGVGCFGDEAGHHIRTVGAGGEDHGNEVPLCVRHHYMVHQQGRLRLSAGYGVDIVAVAKELGEKWDALSEAERQEDR